MRILHLIDEVWDSGLTAYALQIAELLQKSGQDVAVGVRTGKRPEAMARERSLKTIPLNSFFDLRRILREKHWDIVNAHTGRTHSWAVAARLTRSYVKPAFAIVRTRGDARPLKVNPIFQHIYRQTDGVIAASEHIRRQYESLLLIDECKARTIYPAVNVDGMIRTYPGLVVGMLGRLDMIKGHSIFLDAAAQVVKSEKFVRFRVAGKEAGISLQLLQNQVAELGLQPYVDFLGYVPSAIDFMRECSFGVIASIGSEEVSRACLEWMATGRPVIGTIVGCLPELIDTEETGLLVSPGDSLALAEAMIRLLKDPSLVEKWGAHARNAVQKKYSPEIMVNKTLSLYEWVLSQRN